MTNAASRRPRTRGITCPKCRRQMHVVCSRKDCQCYKRIPNGHKPMQWTKDGECERCPYCRFTAHADYWFDRELKACRPPLDVDGGQPGETGTRAQGSGR